jgi:tetratricopeptide (TPR) repeat protein
VRVAPPSLLTSERHRYRIERELGTGGMGTVHLARDLETGSQVAIKFIRPEHVPADGLERFAREIRITSHLVHPNILPVLDVGEADDLPFYVTPYIAGESLGQRLKRETQLSIQESVEIACQIANALEVAHASGFVHRDIKPSNILLTQGQAILADFGLARAIEVASTDQLTESGLAVGTPAYMSPEQSGNRRIDARSDIYSLGCVLYEMLAGEPPFSGPTAQALLARHAVDPVPSLRTVRATVSRGLESVVTKALAKVPADRYASAAELREALQRPGIAQETSPPVPGRRRIPRGALVLLPLMFAAVTWRFLARDAPSLDHNRVMVFPLLVPSTMRTLGEDVATLIGAGLDGTGPLRWIDAWPLLRPAVRDDIRTLSLDQARRLARSKRCAYYLNGRMIQRGDSADVLLELRDVQGDSTVARGRASGRLNDAWSLGLHAVNDVLPTLIRGAPPDLVAEWKTREPAAIASFLLGEAAFRRTRLVEALAHYRDAVRADSSFGLAAIRGAQAATWNHRSSEAAELIRIANGQRLPQRYAAFARGYTAYLGGWADSAAAALRQALELDPEMSVAWAQLGEVYTHLLPMSGNVDSMADAAFARARQLDSTAANWLLHPIETRLRKGDVNGAAPLIHDFLMAGPDTVLAAQIKIMDECVRLGPSGVDWRQAASAHLQSLQLAANALKGAGAQLPCAARAFHAVLDSLAGGKAFDSQRWAALVGTLGILLAQGKVGEVTALIDTAIARGHGGTSLYLLAAPLAPKLTRRAGEVAARDRIEFGPTYANCPFPTRLYELGLWEAHSGRPEIVEAIAAELGRRARGRGSRPDSLLARAMAADAALARGDTSAALGGLTTVLALGAEADTLLWDEALPRGNERLALARILLERKEYGKAIEVAEVFDSAWPSVYLLYLPASLELRAEAAEALGNSEVAMQYRNRLARLGGERTVVQQ